MSSLNGAQCITGWLFSMGIGKVESLSLPVYRDVFQILSSLGGQSLSPHDYNE
jgi:hypothetical protein